MMDALVPLMFKLLNMTVMFAFIAYMIKKHVMPGLSHGFNHSRDTRSSMRNSIQEFELSHYRFVEKLHQQEATIARLKKTIEQWRMVMEERDIAEKERFELQSAMMQKKAEDHAVMRMHKKIEQRAMARALDRAEHILKQQFMNDESGKGYNASIIKHVQKS